jgi:hypothetical protein
VSVCVGVCVCLSLSLCVCVSVCVCLCVSVRFSFFLVGGLGVDKMSDSLCKRMPTIPSHVNEWSGKAGGTARALLLKGN